MSGACRPQLSSQVRSLPGKTEQTSVAYQGNLTFMWVTLQSQLKVSKKTISF